MGKEGQKRERLQKRDKGEKTEGGPVFTSLPLCIQDSRA